MEKFMDIRTRDFIYKVQKDKAQDKLISDLYCDFYDVINNKNLIQGGCHFLSVLLHIVLSELEIDNQLCLGNVRLSGVVFSHSWIQIDNAVYDIAISHTNNPTCRLNGVVYGDFDTSTETIHEVNYGVLNDDDLVDRTGKLVANMSIGEYIVNCPYGKKYVLDIIIKLAQKHKKYLNSGRLMDKYKNEKWVRK
jgi:hypothetical protein